MAETILRVCDVQKYYGNAAGALLRKRGRAPLTKALDHISFEVEKGEFLGIMGPSGSGKTTLLNAISTIDTVSSGHIYVDGQDITALHGAALAWRQEIFARVWRMSLTISASAMCWRNFPASFPVDSSNAWRQPAPWSPIRR